ncbi:MAG: cysteine hydrolase [Campylobacteraceae bacterium]|nr:cysteine hydrolase [Campylobacteraceae bacterium]
MGIALIIVDIQNDYFDGGKNPLHNSEKAARNARKALDFFRNKNLPVFHIQHINLQEGATFFLPNTNGNKIYNILKPMPDEKVFIKHKPNSFFQTKLHENLEKIGINKIVTCGMMSHMCIDTTVRAAKDYLYDVLVINDACTTKDLVWEDEKILAENVHKTFMASLQGTFAKIINVDELENYIK